MKGRFEPSVVGDVFTHGLLPVEVLPVDLVRAVLLVEALGLLLEPLNGLVVPPLVKVAVLVVLTTLVVKSMGQLVSHHHSHRTVV